MDKVIDNLHIGSVFDANSKLQLSRKCITHIVSLKGRKYQSNTSSNSSNILLPTLSLCESQNNNIASDICNNILEPLQRNYKINLHSDAYFIDASKKRLVVYMNDRTDECIYGHIFVCVQFIHHVRNACKCASKKSTCELSEHQVVSHNSVLVHCMRGISRGASIIVAYLMIVTEFSFDVCMEYVSICRPKVTPNRAFVSQLKDFETSRLLIVFYLLLSM